MFILLNNVNSVTVALNLYQIEMNTELLELILGNTLKTSCCAFCKAVFQQNIEFFTSI